MNESQVFTNALKLATPAERAAYLDRACAGNPQLRAEVEALLAAHDTNPNFLEDPVGPLAGTVDAPVPSAAHPAPADRCEHPGQMLAGRFKLLEPIGEGGMGTVWMAEQTEPIRRLVAIKLIKPGMDSKQVLARFDAERQALALMDHPNIARVFDAGTTEPNPPTPFPKREGGEDFSSLSPLRGGGRGDPPTPFPKREGGEDFSSLSPLRGGGRGEGFSSGRPYFVMELVKGIPITKYCDEHHLTPRQRLELFIPVCQAIQHAHQKGIIHRDIKPSNVLVAMYDDRPVPKVIDFGVAKATGVQLTEATLHTNFGAVVGTLEYMSPEQAGFNQLDVDTRSDIYSLGVLLYELLAGSPPFSKKDLEKAGMLEMLRMIREQEPSKPSTKLSSSDALPSLSANRGTEPARLTRLVRGELDWIVMKALEKDRSRRYETANGFAMDVQRYLADEAVQAGPPSAWYRLRKFARRNQGAVLSGAMVLAAIVAGSAIAVWQAVRATQARSAETGLRRIAEQKEQAALAAAEAEKAAHETARQQTHKAIEAAKATTAALEKERLISYAHRVALAHREWLAGDVVRARQILEACPPDLRHWEWHYLRRLCNTETMIFLEHATEVVALAFHPDGSRIASMSRSETRVWDSDSGREIYRIRGEEGMGLAFSRDGKFLAVAPDRNKVVIHDAGDGSEKVRLVASENPGVEMPVVTSFAAMDFSPDGTRLATAGSIAKVGGPQGHRSPAIILWDVKTGRELQRFVDLPQWAIKVVFSPNGNYVAACSAGRGSELPEPGQARIWDLKSGKLVHTFQAYFVDQIHPGTDTFFMTDIAFSGDSKRLATSGSDGVVRIWDLTTGKEVMTSRGHNGPVRCIAFSPLGNRLASAGSDRIVRIWDVGTGTEINAIRGHTRRVAAIAFSPDGRRLASAGSNVLNAGEIRVWDPHVEQQARTFRRDPTDPGVYGLAFSPKGTYLASGSLRVLNIHEVATGIERPPTIRISPGATKPGPVIAYSPDGETIATTSPDGFKVWNPNTGNRVRFFPDHPEVAQQHYTRTTDIAFDRDGGRVATVGKDYLTIWAAKTGEMLHKIPSPDEIAVAFSPDGKWIATVARGLSVYSDSAAEVRIWNPESGKRHSRFDLRAGRVRFGIRTSITFSPDGTRLAVATGDPAVTVYDAADGRQLVVLRGHTGGISSVSFSPDGRRIATASEDQSVKIWAATTGQELLTLRGHLGAVESVVFSPDERHLASSSATQPSEVRLWDASPVRKSALPSLRVDD